MQNFHNIHNSLRSIKAVAVCSVLCSAILLFTVQKAHSEGGMFTPSEKFKPSPLIKNLFLIEAKSEFEQFMTLHHIFANKDLSRKIKLSIEFEYDPYSYDSNSLFGSSDLFYDDKSFNEYLDMKSVQDIEYKISDVAKIEVTRLQNITGISNARGVNSINRSEVYANLSYFGLSSSKFNLAIEGSKLKHSFNERDFDLINKKFNNASIYTKYEKYFLNNSEVSLRFGSSFASFPRGNSKNFSLDYGLMINKSFTNSKLAFNFTHGLVNESSILGLYQACLQDKALFSWEFSLVNKLRLAVECGFIKASELLSNDFSKKSQNMLLASSNLQFVFSKNLTGEFKYSYTKGADENPLGKAASSASLNVSYYFF